MSGEQNIETVKTIYEAFGRGDLDAILELCADDVDWATDSALEVAPWHGVKHGKAEVPSFFAGIAQTGPVTEFTPLSFAGNDDGDVMVFVRYAFTVTATGKDVATNLHHYFRLRDGKVAYYRGSEDTALIASALST
jgi:ketosteroid isomerase-like protein